MAFFLRFDTKKRVDTEDFRILPPFYQNIFVLKLHYNENSSHLLHTSPFTALLSFTITYLKSKYFSCEPLAHKIYLLNGTYTLLQRKPSHLHYYTIYAFLILLAFIESFSYFLRFS
jgi:hypothetical protein